MAQARGVGVPTPDVLGVEQVDHDGELLSFSIASDSCRAVRSTSSLASCRRTYQVMDLEGHQWTFAEHVADVELEVAHLHGER